jgi:hypothetical protein
VEEAPGVDVDARADSGEEDVAEGEKRTRLCGCVEDSDT